MSTKQILALLNSHIDGDEDQLLSIALQIAAQEARQGRADDAEKLKRLVQKARDQRGTGKPAGGQTPIPLARPRGELQGLVESAYPKVALSSMVLSDEIAKRLGRVVRQQQERATLREHGQTPATHMLLVGPPGTGKTMTASALAGELRLPLFTVRLESLFSRFFGETAGKLRLLFDQIAQTRGVYLLDEFDAIGSRRGHPNDVGEIRRVLNRCWPSWRSRIQPTVSCWPRPIMSRSWTKLWRVVSTKWSNIHCQTRRQRGPSLNVGLASSSSRRRYGPALKACSKA